MNQRRKNFIDNLYARRTTLINAIKDGCNDCEDGHPCREHAGKIINLLTSPKKYLAVYEQEYFGENSSDA